MKLKIKKSLILLVALFVPVLIMVAPVSSARALTITFAASGCEGGNAKDCLKNAETSKIMDELMIIIRLLSAMVGVVAVVMLIIGGIQYTASNGNPQAVAAAKKKITDVFIGLISYIFLWSFLEWLIPGGLWN
jgi:hypothetical protein